MRVVVDRDRCEGNAVCVRIAPEVFTLDDDEYATVTADPIPVEQRDARPARHRRVPARGPVPQRLGGARPCCDEEYRRPNPSVLRVDTRPPTSPY